MKNLKLYDNNIKKRIGAFTLSLVMGVTGLGFTRCSKQNDISGSKEITYSVEKDENQIEYEQNSRIINNCLEQFMETDNEKYAEYDRFIDLNKIDDQDKDKVLIYELNDQENDNYLIDYVYPIREGYFINNLFPSEKMREFIYADKSYKEMTTKTFSDYSLLITPYKYKWSEGIFVKGANKAKVDESIRIEELSGLNGNLYLYYEYIAAAKQDIDAPVEQNEKYNETYGFPERIREGDYIKYQALYVVNDNKLELLANNQTGLGSELENVKSSIKGNLNELIKPISSIKGAESKDFDNSYDFDRYIYGKSYAKIRTRKDS